MNIEQLLQDYESRVPTKDLQKKYSLSWEKITKILKEKSVYRKHNSIKSSKENMEYIKLNFLTESSLEISRKLGINADSVRIIAKKLGLGKKGSGWKYNSCIENLDYTTNEFYYFLGWMASDGNVSSNFLRVTLSLTDKEILENFKKMFPFANIYFIPKERQKNMFMLYIGSKKLAMYLNSLGITPNKARTLNVSEKLWNSHFVRGFFEGDGHVRKTLTISKHTRHSVGFVCASEMFILRLSKYFEDNNILVKITKEKTYFRLNIEGKEKVKKFYDLIYVNCDNWFLKRKKQILDQLFSNE